MNPPKRQLAMPRRAKPQPYAKPFHHGLMRAFDGTSPTKTRLEPLNDSFQATVVFGPFVFMGEKRTLLKSGEDFRLGSRAMDILAVLLERPGEVVTTPRIMSQVWRGQQVEPNTLRVHIAALRKALKCPPDNKPIIKNIAGKGYSFVAPVTTLAKVSQVFDQNEPAWLRGIIGRDGDVEAVRLMLLEGALVTIVGPSGIGKTTLARVIKHKSLQLGSATYFVDLAPLSDPSLVVSVVANQLGLPARRSKSAEIAAYLSSKRALLILDNCEHLLAVVSGFVRELAAGETAFRILATSREAMRLTGEQVFQLSPLTIPSIADATTPASTLAFPAARLFVDRILAAGYPFELSHEAIVKVVQICRKVDGIPLAIEIAAGQVGMFGLDEVASGLSRTKETLSGAKRTVTHRHRTLIDALDWSYDLLSPTERLVLNRLSIHAAQFDIASATAVCGADVSTSLSSLLRKSMLGLDVHSGQFRLLEATRAYANHKLRQSGDHGLVAKLHAKYISSLFSSDDDHWEERAPEAWMMVRRHLIDDVRAALAWAFSSSGDEDLAIILVAVSAPLWFQLSLLDEYIQWAERSLAALSLKTPSLPQQLQLSAALGHALLHTKGPVSRMAEAFEKALELSNKLGISDHRSRAYWGLCSQKIVSGDYEGALARANEFLELYGSSEDPSSQLEIKRVKALALHNLGKLRIARSLLEEVLAQQNRSPKYSFDSAYRFDHRVAATAFLGTTLWIEGFPTRAMEIAEAGVKSALEIDHMPSLCYALSISACPVFIWTGQYERASYFIDLLKKRSSEHHLEYWNLWARSYEAALARQSCIPHGHTDTAHLYMESHLAGPLREVIATICPSITDNRLYRESERQSAWCRPELMRIRGLQLQADPTSPPEIGENVIVASRDLAKQLGTLSWELRSTTSLARLWKRSKPREAVKELQEVMRRFDGNCATADIVAAECLLEELQQ
jgi:predicted ATPase/DNA-binding winged helix-turn-helix (wHTH) protein